VRQSQSHSRLVSGSDDKTVWLWNVGTGQPVGKPLRGDADRVWSVSFSPNGTCIATCSVDKTIRLWDASTGQPVGEPLLGHTETVNSISFSPDCSTRIVSGSDDETVCQQHPKSAVGTWIVIGVNCLFST
jgi:WD40 repeat protein